MALSDKITALEGTADETTKDVTDVVAEIAALKAQVAAGGASQADLDRLDAVETKFAAAAAALKAGE